MHSFRGDPPLVDALCIMTSLLAGLCHQVKDPHLVQPEKHSAWFEVPTPGEPLRLHLRVPAAGTDWDQTKEAMVDETLSSPFPTPPVPPSPDIWQEPSDQGPAAQLQVSGDFTKMIAVFAEGWLDIGGRVTQESGRLMSTIRISSPVRLMKVPWVSIHLMSSWAGSEAHGTTGVWSLVP